MLNMVEVRKTQGTIMQLPLTDLTSGFIVQEIEGLDPVKAELVSSGFARQDGHIFQHSKREPRNLIFRLGLEPDYAMISVRDLRKRLYDFFMPKSPVALRFLMTNGEAYDINGVVETFETALFAKEPMVDISIMCFQPDFYNPTPVIFSGTTTDGENEVVLNYTGTIETGFEFSLNIDRDMTEFAIYHRPPSGEYRLFDFSGELLTEDVVNISTLPGNKYARVRRNSVDTSVLYAVSPQSNWLQLEPGENHIRVFATGSPLSYSIEYTVKYGGL